MEVRCCRPCRDSGPPLPTACSLFVLQPGLPEAAALGQGFPLQAATPFSSRARQDSTASAPTGRGRTLSLMCQVVLFLSPALLQGGGN